MNRNNHYFFFLKLELHEFKEIIVFSRNCKLFGLIDQNPLQITIKQIQMFTLCKCFAYAITFSYLVMTYLRHAQQTSDYYSIQISL